MEQGTKALLEETKNTLPITKSLAVSLCTVHDGFMCKELSAPSVPLRLVHMPSGACSMGPLVIVPLAFLKVCPAIMLCRGSLRLKPMLQSH